MKYIVTLANHEYTLEILDEHRLLLDGQEVQVDFEAVGSQPAYSLLVDGRSYEALVYLEEGSWQVLIEGRLYQASVEDEREKRLRAAYGKAPDEKAEFYLKAPMPGMVVAVPVKNGQTVQKGETLLILESMKMQNELHSPRAGTVARLRVAPGDRVEKKETLMSVE